MERIVAGGYPDVQQRSEAGRTRFFASYISTLLGRNRFQAGVVLYAGARTLSFGERLAAVPLSALWQ